VSWIAVAMGVGSLVAGIYGSRQASKAQNKAANWQGELVKMQRDAANRLMPWGEDMLKKGGAAYTSLLPWYTKAAYGDRSTVQQLMQPELRQIRENYDRPLQQLTELSPRTGSTAASNAAILSGRADAMNNALLGARTEGRAGLAGIAGQLSGLGAGAIGASFGGLQGAASGNSSLMSQLFNIRAQNSADSEAIGAQLVDWLKAYQQWNASRKPAGGGTAPSGGTGNSYGGGPW
jgi:hypothetical protein